MERKTKLYRRYFLGKSDEDDEAEALKQGRIASIAEWVSRSFYVEFRRNLGVIRKNNEPKPGNQEQMLYNIGVRDGIDIVIELLSRLEQEVKESRDAG